MELRRNDAASSHVMQQGDGLADGSAHTTSSGREVILPWKIRSQQAKPASAAAGDKVSPTGKENAALTCEDENPDLPSGSGESKSRKKPRRSRKPWEIWSEQAKDVFFDALNEHGKDFAAIQAHFAVKVKKKSIPPELMKNKEQVRHFYYRSWHKISKHLSPLDVDVKKGTLELYALINYGELRRKIGSLVDDDKSAVRLRELVQSGITRVRVRGKTLRIKTPMCRALKKINDIEGDAAKSSNKLPENVQIELRPRTGEAFARVQALAQNPRVRANMSIQRRLSSLIRFLERKWRPLNMKKRLELLNTDIAAASLRRLEDKPEEPEKVVRLFPKKGVNLSVIKVIPVDPSSKMQPASLSLNSHRERCKAAKTQQSGSKEKGGGKGGQGLKRQTSGPRDEIQVGTDDEYDLYDADGDDDGDTTQSDDTISDEGENEICNANPTTPVTPSSLTAGTPGSYTLETELCSPGSGHRTSSRQDELQSSAQRAKRRRNRSLSKVSEEEEEEFAGVVGDPNVTSFFGLIKLGERAESNIHEFIARHKSEGGVKEENEGGGEVEVKRELTDEDLAECEKVKAYIDFGWSREAAKQLTVGELYVMFGKPDKIMLEYEFVDAEEVKRTEGDASVINNCDMKSLPNPHPRRLLKRLVEFASFSLQKAKAIRESQRFGGSIVPLPRVKPCNPQEATMSYGPTPSFYPPPPAPGKKRTRAVVEVVNQSGIPAAAGAQQREEFLFRVPLSSSSQVATVSIPAGVTTGAGGSGQGQMLSAPGPPQIKKLKKGDVVVRRIVPVVASSGSTVASTSSPGSSGVKRAVGQQRKPSKKIVFHQAVPTSRAGGTTSVVKWSSAGDSPASSASNRRMNEALKNLLPAGSIDQANVRSSQPEHVISTAGGNLQTSFPVNYGMRKVVRNSLEAVNVPDEEPPAPAPLPDNAAPPASPSALSLLMDISFPDSEIAMASQIMATQRGASPTPSAVSYSSFTGLIRSLAETFEVNTTSADGEQLLLQQRDHQQQCDDGHVMTVMQPLEVVPNQPLSDAVNGNMGMLASSAGDQSGLVLGNVIEMGNQSGFVLGSDVRGVGVVGTDVSSLMNPPCAARSAILAELCPGETSGPLSPTHLLQSDHQWLASEDVSLGSLLRHLESPVKSAAPSVAGDPAGPSTSHNV